MTENLRYTCGMKTYNYVMEPGDSTLYRFFYGYVPLGAQKMLTRNAVINDAYIISSGISDTPESWIQVGINMPSGSGLGVINKETLRRWPDNGSAFYDMRSSGHGFTNVDKYVICAVLFALKVLVFGAELEAPGGSDAILQLAADEMLRASKEISKYVG